MKKIFSFIVITFFGSMVYGQDSMLCVGKYWSEDEANIVMKRFASEWSDVESWEQRALRIKKGIIEGMQLDKMPLRVFQVSLLRATCIGLWKKRVGMRQF